MRTVFITGSNRGLGLEFARQCAARGDRVFASCRRPGTAVELNRLATRYPDQLTVLQLDVNQPRQIAAAAQLIASRTPAIDLLVNNSAIMPRGEKHGALDADTLLQTLQTNAVAPIMVAQRFTRLLARGSRPLIANVSSQLGSLTRKASGGLYSYSSSKAALNMLTRILAFDLQAQGITAVAFHPGWVRTDMGGKMAPLSPEESISGILAVIENLTIAETGLFFSWNGDPHPW